MARTPLEYIEYLHTKPHHVRQRVAVVATFCVSALIFSLWLSTMRSHLAIYREDAPTFGQEARQDLAQIASPLGALWGSFTGLFK